MKKICCFLRGVNVKGTSMKMADLKTAFEKMGFTDISTIQASGNVIFDASDNLGKEELKQAIEKQLSSYFQYDANVFLRERREIEELLSTAKALTVPGDCHLYSLICDNKEILEELKALFLETPHEPLEEYIVTETDAFWTVPKGSTLSSEFGSKVLGKKRYKSYLTSRNINTIEKIYKA